MGKRVSEMTPEEHERIKESDRERKRVGKSPTKTKNNKKYKNTIKTASSKEIHSGKLESGKLKSGKLKSGKLESGKLESGKLESGKLESGKLESGKLESGKLESGKLESGKLESGKLEPSIKQVNNLIPIKIYQEELMPELKPVKDIPVDLKRVSPIKRGLIISTMWSLLIWIIFSAFVTSQIIPLYKATSWHSPELAAVGSLITAFIFTAYLSKSKSVLSIVLCMSFLGYEAFFVGYATYNRNKIQAQEDLEKLKKSDLELTKLERKMNISEAYYEKELAKYNNLDHKMHDNLWFKNKYITPAKKAKDQDTKEYLTQLSILKKESSTNIGLLILEIMFRLLLISASMLLMHSFLNQSQNLSKGVDLGETTFEMPKVRWV